MKSRLATILSVAGVLTAGGAAALVNTRALSGSASTGSSALVATDPSAASNNTFSVTVPAPTQPPTTAPAVMVLPVSEDAASTQTSFAVGDAGVVTLDRANGVLTVVSAVPNDGNDVNVLPAVGPAEASVVFRSASAEITFTATLANGEITTSVTAVATASPTAPASGGGTSSGSSGGSGTSSGGEHETSHEDNHASNPGGNDD